MNKSESVVKKTESAIDDLLDLWKRRKSICIVVLIIMITPILVSVLTIPHLSSRLREAEQERDKAQLQLAPFLAVANKTFSKSPSDERLELLLKKMEQAVIDVQDAARKIGKERVLSDYLVNKIVAKLKRHPKMTVNITSVLGDTEGFALAKQLEAIFTQAGWPISNGGVSQAVFTAPQRGCSFIFPQDQTPAPSLQEPFLEILDAIGQEKKLYIDPDIQKDNLKIVVGSK